MGSQVAKNFAMKKAGPYSHLRIVQTSNPDNTYWKAGGEDQRLGGASQKRHVRWFWNEMVTPARCADSLSAGDPDRFTPSRTVRLTMGHVIDKSKGGDDSLGNLKALCTHCHEGLQNVSPTKPKLINLFSQVRRASRERSESGP